MFFVKIELVPAILTGMEAVDERVRFGVEKGTRLETGLNKTTFPVEEGFARLHFGRSDVEMTIRVPLNCLGAGEVVFDGEKKLRVASSLPLERVKDLFVKFNPYKPPVLADAPVIMIASASRDGLGYAWTVDRVYPLVIRVATSDHHEALGLLLGKIDTVFNLKKNFLNLLRNVDEVPDWVVLQAGYEAEG